MAHNFYFAWIDTPTDHTDQPFDAAVHNREDEDVFAFKMAQVEGDFATLELVIKNPRIGLLNPARKVWCWFSMNTAAEGEPEVIKPLFKGRLKGVPDNVFDTLLTITFLARPVDFVQQKLDLAETLKVLPYWDPIFIAPESWTDPDTVLEGRSSLWHIDPVTHEVSISDVLIPEDGTIEFAEAQVLYDGVSVQLTGVPLRSVSVVATIPWVQTATGGFDLTNSIIRAWSGGGVGGGIEGAISDLLMGTGGLVGSYTFEGLASSWPKDGANIGDAWTVSQGNMIDQSFLSVPAAKIPDYLDSATIPQAIPDGSILFQPSFTGTSYGGIDGAGIDQTIQMVVIPIGYGRPVLWVEYGAARDLAQEVQFTLFSDMQAVVTMPEDDEALILNVNANKVSDLDYFNTVPIGDVKARDFVHQARGRQAVEHLILMARANLIIRSRAVSVQWQVPLLDGIDITLRKGSLVHDHRLPGQEASGKVVGYQFELDGEAGTPLATITVASAVGYGGSHSEDVGEPTWADASWVGNDWQEFSGTTHLTETSDITFSLPVSTYFDDGVDFQRGLTPANSVELLGVAHPASEQAGHFNAGSIGDQAAVSAVLQTIPTQVTLRMKALNTGPFLGVVPIGVSDLIIPKQIDLEAPSV